MCLQGDVDAVGVQAAQLARDGHAIVLGACDVFLVDGDAEDFRDTLTRCVSAFNKAGSDSEGEEDGSDSDSGGDGGAGASWRGVLGGGPCVCGLACVDAAAASAAAHVPWGPLRVLAGSSSGASCVCLASEMSDLGCSRHRVLGPSPSPLPLPRAANGPMFNDEERALIKEHIPFLELSEEGEAALVHCIDSGDRLVHAALEVYAVEADEHDFQDTLRRVAQRAVSVGPILEPLSSPRRGGGGGEDLPAGLEATGEGAADHAEWEGRDNIAKVSAPPPPACRRQA